MLCLFPVSSTQTFPMIASANPGGMIESNSRHSGLPAALELWRLPALFVCVVLCCVVLFARLLIIVVLMFFELKQFKENNSVATHPEGRAPLVPLFSPCPARSKPSGHSGDCWRCVLFCLSTFQKHFTTAATYPEGKTSRQPCVRRAQWARDLPAALSLWRMPTFLLVAAALILFLCCVFVLAIKQNLTYPDPQPW